LLSFTAEPGSLPGILSEVITIINMNRVTRKTDFNRIGIIALIGAFMLFSAAAPLAAAGAAEEVPFEQPAEPAVETDPAFEQAKPQVREQILQQKQNDVLMEHLEQLRAEAEVTSDLGAYNQGSPETVIASVNGEEITKEIIQQFEQQQLQSIGLDSGSAEAKQMLETYRPMIVDQLINTLLIEHKAAADGIEATEAQIENEYQRYAQQFGGEEVLEQQLEMIGYSQQDLKDEIASQLPTQLYISSYLEQNFDPESVEITEQELREYYDRIKEYNNQ
jgi:FKBP-type peptidyl-prolyl cis-trans isomerase (trigger factor)